MSLPSYVVELQFGASSYVDVTAYVQNVSINRGISRQLDDYSAGSVSITFVNNSRVFDPLNTSSALWYGAGGYTIVQPGGNVRVSSNGVRRFTGVVQGWDFSFDDAGFNGQATVTALDSLYNLSLKSFVDGYQEVVEPTSDRVKRNLTAYGFTNTGISGGQTLVGSQLNALGDSVLTYLQNVARSEPADFYSNSSAVLEFQDRSFTNYAWTNTVRNNLYNFPGSATSGIAAAYGKGWIFGWQSAATSVTGVYSSYVQTGQAVPSALATLMSYDEFNNKAKNNPDGTATSYVFSGWFRSVTGNVDLTWDVLAYDATNQPIGSKSVSLNVGTAWALMSGTMNNIVGTAVGFSSNTYSGGTTSAYAFYGNSLMFERGTVVGDYFDGGYNPVTVSASVKSDVAWAGTAYASYSGLLTSVASTATAATFLTFADQNSQGASYGNGTAIPFVDLGVVYASEQLYNQVQVVGVNATATVSDSLFQGDNFYGVRTYSQTDNLTVSTSKPAVIASTFLSQFRLPEYRADKMTVALEALTSAQQTIVLGVEIRDVIRVCFQPSATGAVVDKYYEVLGVSSNTDVERDHVTFSLASLDNIGFRLDSPILGVLDTDTLS